ncbi:MAG: ABC transporter transmembrane domain-containing protein [Myxococcota bacterium]|nr:ABC transporter transmembrane domain-containing protein [Myxococcota bacterium]
MLEESTSVARAFRELTARVWPFMAPQRGRILVATLCILVSLSLSLIYPQIIRIIIDQGIEVSDASLIQNWSYLLLAVLFLDLPANYFRAYLFDGAARRTSLRITSAVQTNLLKQEIGFFDEENTAELNARALGDSQQIGQLFSLVIPDGIRFGLLAICAVPLMVYTTPILSIVVIAVVPLLALMTSFLGRFLQVRQSKEARQNAFLGAVNLETLKAIRTIRAFSREDVEHARLDRKIDQVILTGDFRARASAMLEALGAFSAEAGIVIGIWLGGSLIVSGRLTSGELVTFIIYAGLVVRSFRNLSVVSGEIMRIHGATDRLFELLRRSPLRPESGVLCPSAAHGEIEMRDICFNYPSRPDVPILRGLNLRIPPGEFLAVAGPSGMGKSTIGNLIVRFYDPDQGEVLFDGHNLRELDTQWLRKQVVLVQQDPSIFSRSIEDNVLFGSEGAEVESVHTALKNVNAHEFIERQVEGIQTVLGDHGVTLSGGQRQRLAIARALLRRPRVLILDEATSALDSENESWIKAALKELDYKPTVIMVAHRLSTIVDADRVILIQDGVVKASGTHSELVDHSQDYRNLFSSQFVETTSP